MKKIIGIALLLLCTAPVEAAESAWIKEEGVSFRLISREDGVGDSTELLFGLQVRLQRGWKFFWRSPGRFGIPPSITLADTVNVAAAVVLWPAPRRLILVKETGDSAVGYDREVVLPIRVRPTATGTATGFTVNLEYGVCGELCIGGQIALRLALPPAGAARGRWAAVIETHLARVPAPLPPGAVAVRRDTDSLVVEIGGRPNLAKPDLFLDWGRDTQFGIPTSRPAANGKRVFAVPIETMPPGSANRQSITLVLIDGVRAWEGVAPAP